VKGAAAGLSAYLRSTLPATRSARSTGEVSGTMLSHNEYSVARRAFPRPFVGKIDAYSAIIQSRTGPERLLNCPRSRHFAHVGCDRATSFKSRVPFPSRSRRARKSTGSLALRASTRVSSFNNTILQPPGSLSRRVSFVRLTQLLREGSNFSQSPSDQRRQRMQTDSYMSGQPRGVGCRLIRHCV